VVVGVERAGQPVVGGHRGAENDGAGVEAVVGFRAGGGYRRGFEG
jgi:hypothetical protein